MSKATRHRERLRRSVFMNGVPPTQDILLRARRLLTAQTFRALAPDQAVALLTVDGTAFDDVLSVPQLTDDDLEIYA